MQAKSTTKPFPAEKFGIKMSAGRSEEDGSRKGFSFIGPQAAFKTKLKKEAMDLEILGSPIGSKEFCENYIQEKINKK